MVVTYTKKLWLQSIDRTLSTTGIMWRDRSFVKTPLSFGQLVPIVLDFCAIAVFFSITITSTQIKLAIKLFGFKKMMHIIKCGQENNPHT